MTVSFRCNGSGVDDFTAAVAPWRFPGYGNGFARPAKLAHGLGDEIDSRHAHPTEVAAAHAHDRSFVWPSAGADHGVVSVTAGARFWHCDRQSDRVRIGAWGNRTHFGLYAHGAVSMIASAASR